MKQFDAPEALIDRGSWPSQTRRAQQICRNISNSLYTTFYCYKLMIISIKHSKNRGKGQRKRRVATRPSNSFQKNAAAQMAERRRHEPGAEEKNPLTFALAALLQQKCPLLAVRIGLTSGPLKTGLIALARP